METMTKNILAYESGQMKYVEFVSCIKQYNATHTNKIVINHAGIVRFIDPMNGKKYSGILKKFQ